MPDDHRFDQSMQLAQFWIARYYARLQYEWKVTLGLWALLAAAITFLLDKRVPSLGFPMLLLLILFGHAVWLRGIWTANKRNTEEAYHWANQAAALLRDNSHKITGVPAASDRTRSEGWFGFLGNWSMATQFGTTIILVGVLYMLAGSEVSN